MFAFNVHPAYVSLGDGIQVAWNYLVATWRRWLPVVIVVALLDAIVSSVLSTQVPADMSTLVYTDPETGRVVFSNGYWQIIGQAVEGGIVGWIVTTVAGWVIAGIAIAGLRARPATAGWIADRGLVAFGAAILVFVVMIGVAILCGVALIVSAALPILLLITVPGILVAFIWIAIRLAFVTLAAFDGHGAVDSLQHSWNLSQKSVLRLLGWGVVAWLIGLVFTIPAGIVSQLFGSSALAGLGSGLSRGVEMVGSCFTTFMMAVLYESQLQRREIMAGRAIDPGPAVAMYGQGGGPYPGGPSGPGWGGAPGYPYPPAGYPPSPYSPAGYPQAQPGWEPSPASYPPSSYPNPAYPGAGTPPVAYPPPTGLLRPWPQSEPAQPGLADQPGAGPDGTQGGGPQ